VSYSTAEEAANAITMLNGSGAGHGTILGSALGVTFMGITRYKFIINFIAMAIILISWDIIDITSIINTGKYPRTTHDPQELVEWPSDHGGCLGEATSFLAA